MGTLRIGNEVVVPLIVNEIDIQPLEVTSNGTYQAPSNSAYNPVNVNVPNTITSLGKHCDSNGIWHYPEDEWSVEYNGVYYDNNIELIPIDTENDEEVLYYLYKSNGESDFCKIRINGNSTVEWGFSKKGIFTSLGSQNIASGQYFSKRLNDFGYRTVIIKIVPRGTAHLTNATIGAWVSDGVLTSPFLAIFNPVLMRYGNIPYANTWCSITSYLIESDNVMNFAKQYSDTNLAMGGLYNGCYNLQRWRNTGWNLKNNNVTTAHQIFYNCYFLSDTPQITDMQGWISNTTTQIGSMFSGCFSWKNPIDVSNWDLSGITSTSSSVGGLTNLFSNMRSITEIRGLETWTGGENIYTLSAMFQNCYNLISPIDLSNMTFGNKLISLSSVFVSCYRIPSVKLPSIDFTAITTMANMFQHCHSLEKIECGEPINTSNPVLTTISNMCTYCISLKKCEILKGVNLTNASITNIFAYCYGLTTTDIIDYTNTIFPNIPFSSGSTTYQPYGFCYTLIKVDLSWYKVILDTNNHSHTLMFRDLYNCEDFYPPVDGFKQINFSISTAQRLTRESIIRILNALPTTSTKLTLTMGAVLLNKLTDEDKAIATGKGWTLA